MMDLESIPNPEDGMTVEVFPGVFYRYQERENSWIRINGYESIKPATQIDAGLMTKEDFVKIDTLLTSPPKTSLTSDQCKAIFETGVIKLYSKDKSLFVEDYLDLYETGDTTREQWHIHEDTWGFNFRVNLQFLVEEMKKRGNLISETIVGPKGAPGDRGEPGVDKLDTGPRGEPGSTGLNAPFDGGLTNTSGLILKDKSKAIVHVGVEQISPEENYLIIHKGVISPEKLCTRKVRVENLQSTWVLVRNQKGIVCNDGCITSTSCEDETAFLDVELIINSIKEHTDAIILKLKQEKESQVREWLKTMMQVFNDQKYALCCGLENCRSRKRNQDERRYIESQRIAAAGSGFNLIISGSRDGENEPEPHTKVEMDMDEFKNCEGPGWIPTVVDPVNPPVPTMWGISEIVFQDAWGGSPGAWGQMHVIAAGPREFVLATGDDESPVADVYLYDGLTNTGKPYQMRLWDYDDDRPNAFTLHTWIETNLMCQITYPMPPNVIFGTFPYEYDFNCRIFDPRFVTITEIV